MKIKIFTTGGSIDKLYSSQESNFVIDEPQIKNILAEANVTVEYKIESLLKKDSLDITYGDRSYIFEKIRSDPANRILITHGTDTMIETAKTLQEITNKTIVFTGAFHPAVFKKTDAYFNVGAAFLAVQNLVPGIYIVINGRTFEPSKAQKNATADIFEIS